MFIAGLPRSRTAWLSVFMSQSGIYFHHEAINGCHSIGEYTDKISGCGDSSTALTSIGVDVIKGSKVVVIHKNDEQLEKCISWCDVTYGMDSREFITNGSKDLRMLKGLHIQQSDIDFKLKDIWEYLVDTEWDNKYSNLKHLNIQVNSTEIDKMAAVALYESIQ